MVNRSVLFYRHFEQYSGGHQKVFDYFSHLRATPGYQADICFSQTSQWNSTNPWFPDTRSVDFLPDGYDYLFIAGMDWAAYSQYPLKSSKPIINLIQHVRHAEQTGGPQHELVCGMVWRLRPQRGAHLRVDLPLL